LKIWCMAIGVCFAAILVGGSVLVRPQEKTPETILFNGKIFTSDSSLPYAQAVAIRGERIMAVGDSEKIKMLAGAQTKQLDLRGRTVIPGINDAHNHVDLHPANEVDVEAKSMNPSAADVKAAIMAAAAKAAPHALLVLSIGGTVFGDVTVNRDSLDKVAPANPVELETFTGHGFILNSEGLNFFGVMEDSKDPLGGRYERDASGRLTGVVREYAGIDMQRYMSSKVSDADAVAQLRQTFDQAAKFGITTIQDMSDGVPPERDVELFEKVPVQIRIRIMRMPGTTAAGRDILEGQGMPRHPSELITVSGTKWMLDGVPVEGTFTPRGENKLPAAPPYDVMFRTLPLTFSEKEIAAILQESLKNDDQLMVHVSGYVAATALLNAMDASGGVAVWGKRRVRVEHGDGIFPDLAPRVKSYGIVVVQNPSHFAPFLADRSDLFKESQPLKSLMAAGIPVALGSDGPTNPYLNIMFASTHGNHTAEAITREKAVVAYTLTSAYAEFAEKDKGSITVGKLADLAVLSQDILTVPVEELPKTESVLTMVGGKTVYDSGALKVASAKN
jgi:predicted amidohydrolase YtcJ